MDDRPPARQDIVAAAVAARWGPVHIAASPNGVVAISMTSTAEAFAEELAKRRPGSVVRWVGLAKPPGSADRPRPAPVVEAEAGLPALRHLRAAAAAIEARDTEAGASAAADTNASAASPPSADALVLDLSDRPAWDRAVLEAVRAIPRGEVRSYGQIARAIDKPGAARAVGGAVGRNPIAVLVPCHRVVAGDGTLGGYGGGWWGDRDRLLDLKAELLAAEGVHLPRSLPRGRRSG